LIDVDTVSAGVLVVVIALGGDVKDGALGCSARLLITVSDAFVYVLRMEHSSVLNEQLLICIIMCGAGSTPLF